MYHIDVALSSVVSSLSLLMRECTHCEKMFLPNTNRMKACTRCTGRKHLSPKRGQMDTYDP